MGVVDHFGQGLPTGCFETQPTFFFRFGRDGFSLWKPSALRLQFFLKLITYNKNLMLCISIFNKGQLISKGNFSVFNSPKKRT